MTPTLRSRYARYALTALSGAVWGLALARTVALSLRAPFFFGTGGGLAGAAAGIVVALVLAHRAQRTAPVALLLPAVDLLAGEPHPWRGPVLLAGGLALALLLRLERPLPRRVALALTVLVPLAVYLPDLSPYVGRADTFEFQVVAPRLGIAHPSGYPLYILLGKLFSLLPLGSVAWRVNLSSAACAALAAGLLFLTLTRAERHIFPQEAPATSRAGAAPQAPPRAEFARYAALVAALTLAFSPTLWSRAVEAEVYALNALLVALALWIATRWAGGSLPAARALPALGLTVGVAMASHLTLGALAFVALPLLLTERPRPTFRTLLLAAGLGLAGLALYLYVPLRWPAVTGGSRMSAQEFLRFVTNADSGGALRPMAFTRDLPRWGLVFRLFRAQIGWTGLALAAGGWILLVRRQWTLALGTLLAFAAWVWFNLGFYVADPDYSAFLVPAHVVAIFWMGLGAAGGFALLRRRAPRLRPVAATLLLLLPLSRLWITGPALETAAQGRADEAWGRYALRQPLAEGAAILADSEKFPPLYYLQQVAGLRPDLEMVTLFNEAQYREALAVRLEQEQRVYMARYLPGLDLYGVQAAGPLVEVAPEAPLAAGIKGSGVTFGAGLRLEGYALRRDPEGRPMHHLALVWQVTEPITEDLTVRLRLVTPGGEVAWAPEGSRPVLGYTVTSAWREGTAISDYYPLRWPPWLPAGRYRLEMALAPRFSDDLLPVEGGEEDPWMLLESLEVAARPRQPLRQRHDALFGGSIWLTGSDLPGEAWAGALLAVELAWEPAATPPEGAHPVARWVAADGAAQPQFPLEARGNPAELRQATYRYDLEAPDEPGRYRLEVGWRSGGGELLGARCRWMGPESGLCPAGEVRVGPSNVGAANFDNRILLVSAAVDAGDVPAGGQLHADLIWRGLRAMDEDYTVFVQVVGPDGKLYGQVDSWPVQGARPTSGWAAGEELRDTYHLYLQEEMPPGEYRVIAGWYLLADMRRLPVLGASGGAIGDYYEAGRFTLP